jgi:hypothetical protein
LTSTVVLLPCLLGKRDDPKTVEAEKPAPNVGAQETGRASGATGYREREGR